MSEILKIVPFELIILIIVFIIIPTILSVLLRKALYSYLINSANRVSRLLAQENRGEQLPIVSKLEERFKQASHSLEQVNTIALIDGLYSQEKFSFAGISLRCEQWDSFCRTLPNLLLAIGLIGTFVGISLNLYDLSQTISQTGTNADDLNNLVSQIQKPLQNMGIAFSSSLFAIASSFFLSLVNLRLNTSFAKSYLITALEDYLDNIYKIQVQGDTRLDRAVNRMVKQQNEFLERFHERVGQVLETTIGRAANRMVDANLGFQNNVDSMVSRFNDISASMNRSTNSFQEMTDHLKTEIQTVSEIVPQFTSAANMIESSSNLYLEGAEKIKESKFSEHLESLTANLDITQKSFSESTVSLKNQVQKIAETQQQTTELAQQVYSQLDQASDTLKNSSICFLEAAGIFKKSDFADKLASATNELVTISPQFNQSTEILQQSTTNLQKAINKINAVSDTINSLIESVSNLNTKSTDLLEQSDRHTQEQINSFGNIQDELKNIVGTLNQHKAQINTSIGNFGEKILTSFTEQGNNNITELQNLTSETKNNLNYLQNIKDEIIRLINISEQQTKQVNSHLNGIGIMSDRLLNSFEDRSQDNIKEIQRLTTELNQLIVPINNIPLALKELMTELKSYETNIISNIDSPDHNLINKANQ
ncbi:MAG: hypothetical protein AAFQ80_18655 [Cyanobacteria bacterium J06621_8]